MYKKLFGRFLGGTAEDTAQYAEEDWHAVCKECELKDGELRDVEIDGTKILLVKDSTGLHAIGAKCTHYGAPLSKGALCNGRIRCPWHGACFSVVTGDIEDYPGLDSLPKYTTTVKDGQVYVLATQEELKLSKRIKTMACPANTDPRTFLIIGSGGAATVCAETLRQEGFEGRVIMATKERHHPYDRPKLSKALDVGGEALALRPVSFYSEHNIEVLLNHEAVGVHTTEKSVKFKDGPTLHFDKLLVATGGRPRELSLPGSDLENVFYLRTPDDGIKITAAATGKEVLIVGNSFIGMEVACFLTGKASSVTVVGTSELPFEKCLGRDIGSKIKQIHEEKGIKFIGGTTVTEFLGDGKRLASVQLKNGVLVTAQVCLIGAGVTPSTDMLVGSGVNLSKEGHVIVDKKMQTCSEDIYAAGDIVQFPLCVADNAPTCIGHWQMACAQGRIAALNMLGKDTEISSVPFFWTVQFGKSLRYTGYAHDFDDIVIHGDVDACKFVAFYTRKDRVLAVASLNFDPVCAQAAELLGTGQVISKEEIRHDPLAWTSRLQC